MSLFDDDILLGSKVVIKHERNIKRSLFKSSRDNGLIHYRTDKDNRSKLEVVNVYLTKEKGFILPLYIKKSVQHQLNKAKSFAYVEVVNNHLYWLIVDNIGAIASEKLYDLNIASGEPQLVELQVLLDKYSEQCEDQEFVLITVNGDAHLSVPHIHQSILNAPDSFILNGQLFDIIESKTHIQGIAHTKSMLAPIIDGKLTDEQLNGLCGTLRISNEIRKNNTKIIMTASAVCACLAVGTFITQNMIAKEAEEKNRTIMALAKEAIVDPYKDYRELITGNSGSTMNAESAFTQLSYLLATLEQASLTGFGDHGVPLKWTIDSLEVKNGSIIIRPKSNGGRRSDLAKFAKRYNITLFTNNDGLNLGFGFVPVALQPIGKEFFHRSIDSELDYLTDSLIWLTDDTTINVSNRASNGEGESHYLNTLVSVDFKCWLPQTFLFVGTQLAGRNYSFHSLEARNDSNSETVSNCGLSGKLNLEVFSKN
jgi:hypothetical protein